METMTEITTTRLICLGGDAEKDIEVTFFATVDYKDRGDWRMPDVRPVIGMVKFDKHGLSGREIEIIEDLIEEVKQEMYERALYD